jgi:sensor histidine kinase regulating citrate/malate metabolism
MMPVVSLLLVGLGSLKKFLFKHWKLVLIVVVAVGLVLTGRHYLHQYGERQFRRGVDATIVQMKKEVAKRNVVNRAVEQRTETGINDFAAAKVKQDEIRHAKEDKVEAKIAATVDSVPMWSSQECAVTSQVLADRNAIRALGPKAEGETK